MSDPPAELVAAINSPWSSTPNIDADVLPSATVLQAEPPPPTPAVPIAAPAGSRTAMVVGLCVAAAALIAAVIYFVMMDRGHEEDPDDVNVGSEQRDYGEEPSAAPAPSATVAAPAPPKPTIKAPPAQPKKSGDDPYDGL